MTQPYKSIETVYERDKITNVLDFGKVRDLTWNSVGVWILTEKVDGTNIRVTVTPKDIQIRGRSDNANLGAGLIAAVLGCFPAHDEIIKHFADGKPSGALDENWSVTFYGEGYGPGIQGSEKMNYRLVGKAYRCYDVMFYNSDRPEFHHWSSVTEWLELCEALRVPHVPLLGDIRGIPRSREEALDMLSVYLPESIVAKSDQGVSVRAEGVVARPAMPLFDRYNSRVIWKLTYREFDK